MGSPRHQAVHKDPGNKGLDRKSPRQSLVPFKENLFSDINPHLYLNVLCFLPFPCLYRTPWGIFCQNTDSLHLSVLPCCQETESFMFVFFFPHSGLAGDVNINTGKHTLH